MSDLFQDREWTTAEGETIRLENMTTRHMGNLLNYLHRNAEGIKLRHEMALLGLNVQGDHASDDLADALGESVDQDAHVWMDATPLVQRLRTLHRTREAAGDNS